MKPQLKPRVAQSAVVFGVHCVPPPQTLAVPPPPQMLGEMQLFGQARMPPQPSAIGPHRPVQSVEGTQAAPPSVSTPPPPQTFAVPAPPQIWPGVAQVEGPHATVLPQPSATLPQFMLTGHAVSGVHAGDPHWFPIPAPPQMLPPVQFAEPQSRTPPHPSAIFPHWLAPQAVSGVQVPPGPVSEPPPQTLGVPPPPQTCGAVQLPQLAVTPPQASGCGPHLPV
jgi:hypothetical protein